MTDLESLGEKENKFQRSHVTVYRFDLFKGMTMDDGKIAKVKSVGSAFVREGLQTYTVHLKTLLKDTFYLLPNMRPNTVGDYVILTRELSQKPGKKYFWNNVGVGMILDGENRGLMRLTWDVLMGDDLYMTLEPAQVTDIAEAPASALNVAA